MLLKIFLIVTTLYLGAVLDCSIPPATDQIVSDAPNLTETSPTPTATRTDCEYPETGWKKEKLSGQVKSLREEEIEYGYGDHKRQLKRLVTFRADGHYIKDDEKESYRVDDYTKIPDAKITFDDNCRVIERNGADRENGAVISYSPSGKVLQEAIYDTESRLVWKSEATLDEHGYVVATDETIQVHPEHFTPKRYDIYRHTRSVYENDSRGNPTKQLDWKYDGTFYATYLMAYDDQNRLIRKLRRDDKDRPIDLTKYSFDELGRLTEEWRYDSSEYGRSMDELLPGIIDSGFGIFQTGYRIAYEFDKYNNWTKKTEYDLTKGGKLGTETFRTLTYY